MLAMRRTTGPFLPPLTCQCTVGDARSALAALGQDAAVVMDGSRPVGVITAKALRGFPGHVPHTGALLGDVMDFEAVEVDPGAEVLETMKRYTDASWESLRRRRPCAVDTLTRRAGAFGFAASARFPHLAS